jgi:lysophospholipase L1-like esterase
VAIGASETLGFGADDPVRQGWTQVFYRTALPRATTQVNLGIPGATVQEALEREVPEARQLHPDVVTVWLNVNDLLEGVSPSAYEDQLRILLSDLRGNGGPTVLVANTPPLDLLPRRVRDRYDVADLWLLHVGHVSAASMYSRTRSSDATAA